MTYVRWSELTIDSDQLDSFIMAASENVRQTRLTELGVVAFYPVVEKEKPDSVHVLEIYTNLAAYQAHIQTPHFQHFRLATNHIVLDRKLFEATPVTFSAKLKSPPPDAAIHIAKLEIDHTKLDDFYIAVREIVGTSIRYESGVLAIYIIALKDNPSQLRCLEFYSSQNAYDQHLDSPHYKAFYEATRKIVFSRKLKLVNSLSNE